LESSQLEKRSADSRFLERLPDEFNYWQGRGIIAPEQGRAIIGSYEMPDTARATHGRLVTILAILGSVLVGLGVILFFASNWQEISREVKLALMLVAVPTAYGIGYWLRYLQRYQRVGTAALFLAGIIYGAAIHLVAQAYNIPVNHPNLFLFWFLGVIPLAYITRSESITVLGIGLFLGAVGFRIPVWLDNTDLMPVRVFPLYLVLGLMIWALGKVQSRFDLTRVYSRAYEVLGILTTFAALYLLTFRFWWEELLGRSTRIEGIMGVTNEFWLTLYIAAALAVAAFIFALAARLGQRLSLSTLPYESIAALLLLVPAYLVVFLPFMGGDLLYPLLFNFLFLVGIVGLIFLGYFRGQELFINMALIFFSVDVVTRYFEYSFELLDRSIVFIVAGIILLLGGFLLELGRRQVVDRLRAQEASNES
jgi:uncharacterized membrane protein